jgi:DNA end-binding protein Ku
MRGYEAEPGRYVTFRNEDLRRLRPATSTQMEIVRSVPAGEIDPVYLETSYYAAPDRGGEHAYGLLFAALRETGHAALARVAMHGREHIVVLRAGRKGLLAHTMYYADEVKSETEYRADTAGLGAKELDLAKKFVDAIAGPFAPEEFRDTYRENLEKLIAERMSRGAVAAESGAAQQARTEAPPVADIVEALKKSLELQRKPAASERRPTQPAKVTEIGRKAQKRKA